LPSTLPSNRAWLQPPPTTGNGSYWKSVRAIEF
jgi:hypothetical protein